MSPCCGQGLARPDFTATSGIRGALPGRPIMHDDSADIGSVERRGAAAVSASVRSRTPIPVKSGR